MILLILIYVLVTILSIYCFDKLDDYWLSQFIFLLILIVCFIFGLTWIGYIIGTQ